MAGAESGGGAASHGVADSERAFYNEIFAPFKAKIYSHVYRGLRSAVPDPAASAEELTGNVLVKAWKQTRKGLPLNQAWMYKVADNELRNHLEHVRAGSRDLRKTQSLDEPLPGTRGEPKRLEDVLVNPQEDPEQGMLNRESAERIMAPLRALSALQRHAFLLHYLEGYPYAVIANLLDTSEGAARNAAHQARQFLRDRLAVKGNQHG